VIFTTHDLGDGTRVRLRLARPSDSVAVQAFLGDVPELAVRRLMYYDPHERLTLLAMAFEDGSERIVGLADATFRGDGEEIALTVRDDMRRQGLDTLLADAVAYTRLSRTARRRRAA
jgi:GNAT superfamily N-acetyltransferase